MCMSPHQMTSVQVEYHVRTYREYAKKPGYESMAKNYNWHADQLEKMLKERAENGTYDTAGHKSGDRNVTQRTEYQSA